jgi:hypothetical protein
MTGEDGTMRLVDTMAVLLLDPMENGEPAGRRR